MLELPLHAIAEDTGGFRDAGQVAVTMEYAVQGKGTSGTRQTLNYSCLYGAHMSLDPDDRVIARPTQAWELQGEFPDSFIKQDTSNLNSPSYQWCFPT